MVYDDMKLLLFPTFISDSVWVLFYIENKISLQIKKEKEKKDQNTNTQKKIMSKQLREKICKLLLKSMHRIIYLEKAMG